MINFTSEDAVASLKRAENLNGVFKRFLKREVRKGDAAERFVKDFKEIMLAPDSTQAVIFLTNNLPQFAQCVAGLAGYAHSEMLLTLREKIVTEHADTFNQSYKVEGEAITVTDAATFKRITKAVLEEIKTTFSTHGFADSRFMTGVILSSIFDPPVLAKIIEQEGFAD